jgi:hypothetical protein
MRRTIALAALALAAVPPLSGALPHAGRSTQATQATQTTHHTVTVQIRCASGRIASSEVSPDPVEMVQGDSLDWTLTDDSDVEEFSIEPQTIRGQTKPWPFADELAARRGRKRARGGEPARARRMRADAEGRYRYAIVAQCPTGQGGETREVEIDPDIIIRAR